MVLFLLLGLRRAFHRSFACRFSLLRRSKADSEPAACAVSKLRVVDIDLASVSGVLQEDRALPSHFQFLVGPSDIARPYDDFLLSYHEYKELLFFPGSTHSSRQFRLEWSFRCQRNPGSREFFCIMSFFFAPIQRYSHVSLGRSIAGPALSEDRDSSCHAEF